MSTYQTKMLQEAAQKGVLVYYMSQSLTAPMAEDGPWGDVANGYCAGLSVRWIKLAYAGKDFIPSPASLGDVPIQYFNGTDWQATVYQTMLSNYYAAGNKETISQAAYALSLAQMQLGSELREMAPVRATGERLSRVVAKSYGCYWVTLKGPKGSHAIALRHARPSSGSGPGELHIFDPNYGHFMWQAKAATWPGIIDWFLGATDYWTKYTSRYLIARVTPPVN